MDNLKEELEAVFNKHGIKDSIVIVGNDERTRVLIGCANKEVNMCELAIRFQHAVQVSEGLRDLLDHVSKHCLIELEEELKLRTQKVARA